MTHAMLTKILVNLSIFLVIFIFSWILLVKIKFNNKGYRYLFIVYSFYWMAPMLLRPYAGTMQNAIDLNFTWIVLAAYGFVGIVIRPFADWLNFVFKSRKTFLYLSIIIQLLLYIPIIISPNTVSDIFQSIGVGVGASCIGTFQLMFKEQYNSKQSYLTVSLLSIPPLIANFLTSPIQSIVMIFAKTQKVVNIQILKYLWVAGLIFTIITLIMMLFLKQRKITNDLITNQNYEQRFQKNEYWTLIIVMLVGLLITFIKFSTSSSVSTLHLQTLGNYVNQSTSAYEGYLSVIFSLFQLLGGILVGLVFVKKMNNITIFGIGSLIWVIYMIMCIFNKNPIIFFIFHGLSGLAYGVLYNFVLGKILSKQFNTNKITPMGVYQGVLAIGISLSGFFTQFIKNNLKLNYWYANTIINVVLSICTILLFVAYFAYDRIDQIQMKKYKNLSIKI